MQRKTSRDSLIEPNHNEQVVPTNTCSDKFKVTVAVLLIWQFVSLMLTCTSIFSQNIADYGINAPTFQSFLLYASLCIFFGPIHLLSRWNASEAAVQRRNRKSSAESPNVSLNEPMGKFGKRYFGLFDVDNLQWSWFAFFLLALVDVEGNFSIVLAFQYTNLVSVQLLDCAAIPAVMTLSILLNKTSFSRYNYIGSFVCVIGLAGLVLSDYKWGSGNSNQAQPTEYAWKGDLFVLLGAGLYALSNVGQELIVKSIIPLESELTIEAQDIETNQVEGEEEMKKIHNGIANEVLCKLGFFGSLISILQSWLIGEIEGLIHAHVQVRRWTLCLNFFGFALCMFMSYTLTPRLLQMSSATVMNLSYLTSDFWSLLAASVLYAIKFNGVYMISFAVIISGIVIYHLRDLLS